MLLISRAIYLYLSQSGYIVISSLADPDAIRLAVDKYLSWLNSKIFALEREARPLEEEIKGLKAKMRRAKDLYMDGNMDNVEHEQNAPVREKVQILEANNAEGGGVAIRQLGGLRQSKALHKAGHAKRLFGGSQFPPAWT